MQQSAKADAINDPERYVLITALLHSAFTKNKYGKYLEEYNQIISRISLPQLVNRVFLLFQCPIIFTFYKKEHNKWILKGHTVKDKTFEKQFNEKFLKKFHENINDDLIIKDTNYLLPLERDRLQNYAVGIIKLERYQVENTVSMKFDVCKRNDEYIEILENQIKHFFDSQFSKEIGLIDSIGSPDEIIKSIFSRPTLNPNHWNIPLRGAHQRVWDTTGKLKNINEFIDDQLGIVNAITNNIYKKVSDDFVVSSSGKKPPNIFFFQRYYDPMDFEEEHNTKTYTFQPRFNDQYAYSIKRVIPKLQRKDLISTLKSIHKISRSTRKKDRWQFLARDKYNNDIGMENNAEFPSNNNGLSDYFWNDLEKVDFNNSYEQKITELEKPFNFKSIVDPVFLSSFTHIRNNPFSGAALDRAELSNDVNIKNQVLYTYYLYAAAALESTAETLSVMTVPLTVSGITYMTVSHVIDVKISGFRSEAEWKRNYFFFSDVVRKANRILKKKTKKEYYQQLENNVLECLISYLDGSINSTKDLSSMINDNNYNLCRVWPFEQLKVIVYDLADRPEDYRDYEKSLPILGDNFLISWKQLQNPFFIDCEIQNYKISSIDKTMTIIANLIENYTMIHGQQNAFGDRV